MPDSTPPPPLPIIDAHHHLWDLSVRAQPFLDSAPALAPLRRTFSLAHLAPLAAAAGVSATVVVQTVTEPGETPELLALAGAGGLIAGVVGWADLAAADAGDQLARLAAAPGGQHLAGIRHPLLTEPDPGWLDRPGVRRGLAAVAAAGLVFDIVGRPGQLPPAIRAAAALPGLIFVLDHLGNPDVGQPVAGDWAAAVRQLAALPNTVAKVSGILGVPPPGPAGELAPDDPGRLAHLRPYVDLALDSFGPDRLMFGSDWPVSTIDAPYDSVVAAGRAVLSDLSPAEQAAILSGTARRVYRLAGE
jgi:L-fuconolactonase